MRTKLESVFESHNRDTVVGAIRLCAEVVMSSGARDARKRFRTLVGPFRARSCTSIPLFRPFPNTSSLLISHDQSHEAQCEISSWTPSECAHYPSTHVHHIRATRSSPIPRTRCTTDPRSAQAQETRRYLVFLYTETFPATLTSLPRLHRLQRRHRPRTNTPMQHPRHHARLRPRSTKR